MLEQRTRWFPSAVPPHLALCDSVTLCAHNASVPRTWPAHQHTSEAAAPPSLPPAAPPALRPPSPPPPAPPGGGRGAEGGASGRRRFRRPWRRGAANRGRPTWRRTRRSSSSPKVRTEPNRNEPGWGGEGAVGAGWRLAAACGSGAAPPVAGTQSPGVTRQG